MSISYTGALSLPVSGRDHIRGAAVATVTMVEYGDYECPHCAQAQVVIEEVLERAGSWLQFAYRHFPLTQIHPHAQQAAEAAEAAGVQGSFWEMHDLLFPSQHALSHTDLIRYANWLGLDMARFTRALAIHAYAPRVREDFLSGVRSGVNGTPTFFIDDVRYDGPRDVVSLLTVLRSVAEKKGS